MTVKMNTNYFHQSAYRRFE